jgi:hypothetical protein
MQMLQQQQKATATKSAYGCKMTVEMALKWQ